MDYCKMENAVDKSGMEDKNATPVNDTTVEIDNQAFANNDTATATESDTTNAKMDTIKLTDVTIEEKKNGDLIYQNGKANDSTGQPFDQKDSEKSQHMSTKAFVVRLVLCLFCGLVFGFLAVKGQGN